MRNSAIILSFVLLIAACNKDDVYEPVDLGYDYYPSAIGSWLVYDVDSIVYNDFTVPPSIDTFSYQVRELYESYYLDASNDSSIRIEQSVREGASAPWQISHIASLKHTVLNTQKTERDLTFIRMVYPPSLGKDWAGHLYLDVLDEPSLEYFDRNKYNWNHEIVAANETYTVSGFTFNSTVSVVQIDEENLFEKKYATEVYAKGIGLIYKELLILETQAPPSSATFMERAESGFILRYRLNDYQL